MMNLLVILIWVTKTNLNKSGESLDTHIKSLTYFELTSIYCCCNVAHMFPFSSTFSLCLTSIGNGKFPNEVRHKENTDEHHRFNFEKHVLKDLVPLFLAMNTRKSLFYFSNINRTSCCVKLLVFLSLIYSFCSLSEQRIHHRDL